MPQYPILQTKLYIPPVRIEWVSRTCLLEPLDVSLGQDQGRPRPARYLSRCLRDDNSLSQRVGSWGKGEGDRRGLRRYRWSLDVHRMGAHK